MCLTATLKTDPASTHAREKPKKKEESRSRRNMSESESGQNLHLELHIVKHVSYTDVSMLEGVIKMMLTASG